METIEKNYASAKLLEALTEAELALELLERGLTRGAAGRAFRAWLSLLTSLGPRRRMAVVPLSMALEASGHRGIINTTMRALSLREYQRRGPALGKYHNKEEAAEAVKGLVKAVVEYAERLRGRITWSEEHEEALQALRRKLTEA